MAHDNTVSFKAYLLKEGTDDKYEVRRFGVDRDVVSNFDYLKQKLEHVFSNLSNQSFKIMWKDAEGDDILISTDDELMIALSEMQADVRKLYINVCDASSYQPTKAGQKHVPPSQTSQKDIRELVHDGVICDVCDQPIKGFRYNCLECIDFDLCGTCEAKMMHKEHFMVRISTPVPPRVLIPYLAQLKSQGDYKGYHGDLSRHYNEKFLREIMRHTLVAGEGKLRNSVEKEKDGEEMRENLKGRFGKFKKRHNKKAEYLWAVGQKVAEFLDPWGIDVDVEVLTGNENSKKNGEEKMETEETGEREAKSPAENSNVAGPSQAPQATPNPAAQAEPASKSNVQDSNADGPSQAPQATQVEPASKSNAADPSRAPQATPIPAAQEEAASPETDDWTVLNDATVQLHHQQQQQQLPYIRQLLDNMPLNLRYPPDAPVGPPHGWRTHRAYGMHNYPGHLPAPPPPPPLSHTVSRHFTPVQKPHVAQALQKMMAMGFSNDGGWLSQLLESKDGDIEKALDVLQPVKRS